MMDVVISKDGVVERKLYKDISRLVAGFTFSWSKWNNQKHHEKKFIFRAKGTLSWDSEPELPEKEEEVVRVMEPSVSLSGVVDDFDKEVVSYKRTHLLG